MLEIKNLYVEGKGHAQLLRGVSFSMKLGECIGLTGPSGAGKTTIIKAIMGVLDHTCRIPSGDILLDGVSLPAMPPAKRRDLCGTTLGFIPQNPMTAFDPHIRMGKLMEETFCLRLNCSKAEARKLAADTLRRVNLLDVDRVLSSLETLDKLRELQRQLDALPEFPWEFDMDQFDQLVEKIVPISNTELLFKLKCGLELKEVIPQ